MKTKNNKFHIFKTNSGKVYILDNSTGQIFPSTGEWEDYFNESYSQHLFKNGYCNENFALPEFIPSPSELKKRSMNSGLSQLILILTEKCNLRCEYCIYSEHYPDIVDYSAKEMSINDAFKAVDIFSDWHQKKVAKGFTGKAKVSFYGGEPFLKFDTIKATVEYCESLNFYPQYLLTTNGTIMTDEIIDYIAEKNIVVSFSLDGNKENHDRNRIIKKGCGTHDTVVQNLLKLSEKLSKKTNPLIGVVCCYDDYSDLINITDFFNGLKTKTVQLNIMYNGINRYDTTYYDYCKERYLSGEISNDETRLKTTFKTLREKYFESTKNLPIEIYMLFNHFSVLKNRSIGYIDHLGNTCAIGDKLCVSPDGKIYICERVNQQMAIGDIENGIDWEKSTRIVSEFIALRKEYCSDCNISHLCDLCFAHVVKNEKIVFNHQLCEDKKKLYKQQLEQLYSYLEVNPHAFDSK